jgi:hypothetical protein
MRDIDFMSSGDPTWQSAAKNIILSELRPIQAELDKAVRKSSALSAMKVGVAGLGYAAVGATAGALAGGRITTSLVGAAAGKGSETLVKYLRGIQAQRKGKAVLDLIVSFYPENE